MAEDLVITKGTKEEQYESISRQVEALMTDAADWVANLGNFCAALREQFDWLWIGFYLVKDANTLVLGPFQGPVACTFIQHGKGVCGTSWAKNEILIVPNVEEFPGHIACSSLSKSEIVVPFRQGNKIVGVLDVDSDQLNQFDETDARWLEKMLNSIPLPESFNPVAG